MPLVQDGSSSSMGSAASFFEGSFVQALAAAADGEQRTEGRQLLLLWLHQKVGMVMGLGFWDAFYSKIIWVISDPLFLVGIHSNPENLRTVLFLWPDSAIV